MPPRSETWEDKLAEQPGRPHVLIVGAGFAGLEVARALGGHPVRVTLLDRRNYNLFQPLLYQVATAALAPADIAVPIRVLIQHQNVVVLLEEVDGIDVGASLVRTVSGRTLDFDYLVVATGSRFNYFGHNDWAALAPAPKSLGDAVEIRRRLLLAFERAETSEDALTRQAFMTMVVIGAGATGVEMAGAIAELAKGSLTGDFRRIVPGAIRIVLIEAGSRVLSAFPQVLSDYASRVLTRMGVQILVNTPVDHVDEAGVVAAGQRIAASTVIWAAGVKATEVATWLGVPPGDHGAVKVNSDFSVGTHRNVFVIGDAAEVAGSDRKRLPGLAAVAKQEGAYVGNLLRRRIDGDQATTPFKYRDYGTMATLGRSAAVADLRGIRLTGTFAWLLWGVVHLYFLIGFRNRAIVLLTWFWAWLTHGRGARLITDARG